VSFLAAGRLWLLVLVVVLLVAYVVVQRQRRPYAVRFTNVDLLASVAPKRPSWRRHLAAACSLVAITVLVLAFARPARTVSVPRETATVMLALDVSNSMKATDVNPTRLRAAQTAIDTFVDTLPSRFRLGLVTFSNSAVVAVTPTHQRSQVRAAVTNLTLGAGTAIGDAMFASLGAIRTTPAEGSIKPPARIVLLSDGETNSGRPNSLAVEAAVRASVPVSTIAFGTDTGSIVIDGVATPVPVNRDALREIATATHGTYAQAVTERGLRRTYADIGSRLASRSVFRPVTMWFVGVAIFFAFAAAAGSLVWTSRLP
jgi:Ca-activated chloride channel family protein